MNCEQAYLSMCQVNYACMKYFGSPAVGVRVGRLRE
jgi:hypothetical protein